MAVIKSPNGNAQLIDNEGRAYSFSITQREAKHLNTEGFSFSVYFQATTAAPNDYFFYFKNNGLSDIYIDTFELSGTAASKIYIESVTGTAAFVAAGDAQVTSRKIGNAGSLSVDAKYDSDITGLISTGVMVFYDLSVADTTYTLDIQSDIIIPQGQAIAMRSSIASTIECVLSVESADDAVFS